MLEQLAWTCFVEASPAKTSASPEAAAASTASAPASGPRCAASQPSSRRRGIVLENVAALRHRGPDRVLGDLAALGYDALWDALPASAVGAPHRRDRLFVVAWAVPDSHRERLRLEPERGPDPAPPPDPRHPEPRDLGAILADPDTWRRAIERVATDPAEPGASGRVVDGCVLPRWPLASNDTSGWHDLPERAQPALRRVAHGLPHRVARLAALGNAVAPPVARVIGVVIVEALTHQDAHAP
ncbi:MAG: DNA cytosine methyltransferase [Sandaracinaceae bacterium]|nr:DNA cytosine methyltransferase [Sandaracinaceae bacterium]